MLVPKSELIERIRILEEKNKLQEGLPHLYGFPFYRWAREFFESRNRFNFLCAGNQVSKSSTQIRKCIHWATATELWGSLWRTRPLQFWYLYPTKDIATIEFEKKWIPEFMPRGDYKEHPKFGWRAEYKNKQVYAIHFNTGVSVYFKAYSQEASHLQAGSCYAIFTDEELPEELFEELSFRMVAVDGYFHMVFTATMGQERWRRVIEERGKYESLPSAFKLQISMYDCMFYEDGSPAPWSADKIEGAKAHCKNQNEILKRVYGRFVLDSGLRYPGFDREFNLCEPHTIPSTWAIYAGIDLGSGGKSNHPAAISFVAVKPDHTEGVVFMGWRGDNELTTTSGDVLNKYRQMRSPYLITMACYDYSAKDFYTIATRVGEPVTPAEKNHEIGEHILNVLFKNRLLKIFVDDELSKLVTELCSNTVTMDKRNAKDDFIDSLRYAVSKIPWDFSKVAAQVANGPVIEEVVQTERDIRKDFVLNSNKLMDSTTVEAELDEWNNLYES